MCTRTVTARAGYSSWLFRLQALLFSALIFVEILSSFSDSIAKLGVVLWIASFLWLSVLSVLTLVRQVVGAGGLFSILAVLALAALVGVTCGDFRTSSHEATQEIGCVISGLAQNPSWRFNANCFIGYPARQYFAPALPTLLFGRSLVALNLGNLRYLFVGVIAFVAGVRAIITDARVGDLAATLGIALLFHAGFFPYFFLTAEQSLYPLSLSLLCTTCTRYRVWKVESPHQVSTFQIRHPVRHALRLGPRLLELIRDSYVAAPSSVE